MEFESAQNNTTAKLPILKLGEYEMWVIRIKQYFQVQDYDLWEVIKNCNSWVSVPQTTQENGVSVTKMSVPVTAEEKTNKKNDVKARSLLAILGVVITQEDLNLKFLRSLPPEWNTHVVVWMNKADIETMSINDLYNNFKIVEQDVKKFVGASTGAQNMAFITAPNTSSTNNVNTANPTYEASTVSPNVNTASSPVSTANFSDNAVYAFMVENPNGSNLLQQDLEKIHKDDLEAMDLRWQLSLLSMRAKRAQRNQDGRFKNQDNTRKQGNNKDTFSKEMLAIDGVGFDWSDMAEEQVQTNMALMAFLDSKNEVLFSEEVAVLKREVGCKNYEISVLKSECKKVKQEKEGIEFKIEKFDNASKSLDKLIGSQITDNSKKGLGYHVVPPPHPLIYNGLTKLDLSYSGLDEFKEPKFKGYGPRDSKLESNIIHDLKSDDSKENFDDSFVKEQVSEDTSSFVESSFNVDKETAFSVDKKTEFVKSKDHDKPVRKSISFDMKNILPKESLTFLVAKATLDESILWYKRLGHINFKINKLVKDNLVRGLPVKHFENDQTFVACLKGKQHRASSTKDETSKILKNFLKEIENLVDKKVKIIRCDNRTEFKNKVMHDFCREKGIKREYSVARTSQQNGVAERRIMTLIEAARTMLADSKLPTTFWAEVVSTACYVQNRVLIVKPHNKTPYELFRGFKPALSFMRPFRCHVIILNTLDNLGKFDGKSDEGFFVGYSLSSKDFRVYNTRTRKVDENLHIGFLKNKSMIERNDPKWLFDIDSLTQSMNYVPVAAGTILDESVGTQRDLNACTSSGKEVTSQDYIVMPIWKDAFYFDLPSKDVGNDEPKSDFDDNEDDDKDKFEDDSSRNEANVASDRDAPEVDLGNIPNSYRVLTTSHTRIHKDHPIKNVIGEKAIRTKWAFRNKKDERGIVIRNKTRLVSHGHRQEEGIEYEEVFAPVGRIEEIRLFLAYASFMCFLVYQMDVKSAFLYGTIEEEAYVNQPLGFKDPDHPDKVYKAQWGSKREDRSNIVYQEAKRRYFASTGLQVTKKEDGIFITQDKYVDEILKKFNYTDVKSASTPIDLEKPLVKDGDASDVDVHIYRSMIGSLMYLTASRPDIMFACKKQNVVATSTTEAEYVAAASCCGQDAEISMDLLHTLLKTCTTLTRRVEQLEQDKIAQALEITKLKQKGIIANKDADVDVILKDVAAVAKEVEVEKTAEIEEKPAELQKVVEVVTTAKLMTEVVTAASATITAADTPITAAAPTLTTTPSAARRRKGVVIIDPEETATPSIIIHAEPKSKDKGKWIMIHEPKPLKKKTQIEQDEAYARELEAELNKNIDWDEVIEQVQRKEKEDNDVMRYQALKRKPQTEAQAKKNMMIYLRSMDGFKMDYFKGMTYDDIRPIFEKKFNSNVAFLENTREQMEEEDSKALKRMSESQAEKATKKQKLDEENNKPYYKIIRADGSPQLFLSFLSLLRNFDREDLEVLWQLVKERFASSKPKNFSYDFLLTTLTYMFEKPDVQAQVWKNQRSVHGLAKICKATAIRRVQARVVFGYILHQYQDQDKDQAG
nr:hypothetical protein [Tanacetum cinerariifolium]